ncbi:MAG: hypothetical protein E6I11_03775 [Chloroflexi bacterium]|nr:MAG: hypothetical protein E6I11_03775 [Chloroflexota bacterium]TMG10319.1 MAG: hypothetical protein E6I00_13350 [Chloroflexota bacterium]
MAAIQRTRMSSLVIGIGRLWLLIFVPFAVLTLTFLSGKVVPYTALWGHAAFHLIYLPILAVGWWALWRFVREPSNVALRVIVALMLLCQTSALFGHAGELVSVVQRGFFSAPYSLFSENPHMFFANFAVAGILASELLLIVLTVTAVVQRLLRRSPSVTGGQAYE